MLEIIVFIVFILIFAVLPSIWYLKRKEKIDLDHNPSLIFVILTITLLLFNTYLSYIAGARTIPYILGQVYFIPLLLIGIFSIFKDSRNWKSRFRITFYTSLILFVGLFGNLLSMVKT